MKHLLEVCLVALALVGSEPPVAAQSAADMPMQKGIAVDLPVTSNAVAIPDADKQDALVVAVSRNCDIYLGADRMSIAALRENIRNAVSSRGAKILYIKADAYAPYFCVVGILDSMQRAGLEKFALLTSQRDAEEPGSLIPPKGLEMQIVFGR